MYKIIVNCKCIEILLMKHKFVFLLFVLLLACESNESPDLLPDVPVDFSISLNLPQYQSLLVPGGYALANSQGLQGIVIYNVNNRQYKAFDLACPSQAVNSCIAMDVIDGILLECSCDASRYSLLDGSPQQDNPSFFAKEYSVIKTDANTLVIRNF